MLYRERVVVACAACDVVGEGWACYHGGPALKLAAYTLLPPDWAWDGEDTVCPKCTSAYSIEVDPDVTTSNVG